MVAHAKVKGQLDFYALLSFDLLHSISRLAPFGQRVDFTDRRFFPAPLCAMGDVIIINITIYLLESSTQTHCKGSGPPGLRKPPIQTYMEEAARAIFLTTSSSCPD